MNIVHLCLYGPVMDGWNYQDNMLTKYHKLFGNEVTIVTSKWVWNKNNQIEKTNSTEYVNQDGVRMIRLDIKGHRTVLSKFKRYPELKRTIERLEPDVLFVHNAAFLDVLQIVLYLKSHPEVKTYVDNHNDFSNSASNWISKIILHKGLWRYMYKKIEPYTTRFYGVLPARVDFLINIYKTPPEKTSLLVMGADDEQIKRVKAQNSRATIRAKYGIQENDFLIVTGGKIDAYKTQVLLLMEAIKKFKKGNIKLIVFGSVSNELKSKFQALCDDCKIAYAGWLNTSESYDHFSAADLVVFPGRHSVFWEQVAGMGIPMVCKYWDGTTHVNTNDNVIFLYEDSVEEIYAVISSLVNDSNKYEKLKQNADEAKNAFWYSNIAKKAIEM